MDYSFLGYNFKNNGKIKIKIKTEKRGSNVGSLRLIKNKRDNEFQMFGQ